METVEVKRNGRHRLLNKTVPAPMNSQVIPDVKKVMAGRIGVSKDHLITVLR
jgi:hypothetical protein